MPEVKNITPPKQQGKTKINKCSWSLNVYLSRGKKVECESSVVVGQELSNCVSSVVCESGSSSAVSVNQSSTKQGNRTDNISAPKTSIKKRRFPVVHPPKNESFTCRTTRSYLRVTVRLIVN